MIRIVKGDVDVEIVLEVGADIAGASTAKIKAKSPSGQEKTWTATAEGTTAIKYKTTAGDFDEAGRWTLQAYIEKGAFKGHGTPVEIMVMEQFDK